MRDDSYLLALTAEDIAKIENISYDSAVNLLYNSKVIDAMKSELTTFRTWAPKDLAELIIRNEKTGGDNG